MSRLKNDVKVRKKEYVLTKNTSLKRLETPVVFQKDVDELFSLDEEALTFFQQDVISPEKGNRAHATAMRIAKRWKLVEPFTGQPKRFRVLPQQPVSIPTCRYLLLHITRACNLHCAHCYLGDAKEQHMPLSMMRDVLDQFSEMQGLTVLLSGGEPLRHPDFWQLNEMMETYALRFEMLSNGTLITPRIAKRLNVHYVQISIDGLGATHDRFRGKGSFKKSIRGIEALKSVGIPVGISTMIHQGNRSEFGQMEALLQKLEIHDWIINIPERVGRWTEATDIDVPLEEAARIITTFSRGEGPHKSIGFYTCGSHIMSIMTDGTINPCPFLVSQEFTMGHTGSVSLAQAWCGRHGIRREELKDCQTCKHIDDCLGGCRFRAQEYGDLRGRDPLLCTIYDVPQKG